MNDLLLNVVVWGIAVHSFRIAVTGRLALRVLATTPSTTVDMATTLFQNDQRVVDAPDEVHAFLSELAQARLLTFVIVLVEYVLCIYFLYLDYRDPVAWFIIVKNLLVSVLAVRVRNETMDLDPIQSLTKTPPWIKRLERFMHLLSGVLLLFQFIRINFGL